MFRIKNGQVFTKPARFSLKIPENHSKNFE